MIVVTTVQQTCAACPSQWEGRTHDGRYIYARYRWGHLSVSVGRTLEDAVGGDDVIDRVLGGAFDGVLTYAQLKAATREVIAWPDAEATP